VIKVPEGTVSAFTERRDRSEYRPIRGGISISPEDMDGWYGTLGWFGTLNSSPSTKILITNKHVAFDGSSGTTTSHKKVGQPNYSKVCCCTCGVIGETIVGINNTTVDVAIARLDSDVNPMLLIRNNAGSQELHVDGTHAAIVGETVYKIGARSGYTTGIVADIAGTTTTSYHDSAGNTVTLTRTNEILVGADPAETYTIENGKKAFSNSGDSGSVVLNSADQIVGLLYGGGNPTNATIQAFVSNIAVVLSALSGAGQAITFSNSPPGGGGGDFDRGFVAEARPRLTGTRLDEILERTLDHDPEQEPIVQAARAHFDEMLELVNNRRAVTVTWHRKQGPTFLAAFMRSIKEPDYRIPQEIEGVSRQNALSAMAVVFEEHGSDSLKAAIQQYGLAVIYACSRYDTVEEIVQALNQQPVSNPEAAP
jgi:hypothetical protein